jgi:uncharacterized protein YkwD
MFKLISKVILMIFAFFCVFAISSASLLQDDAGFKEEFLLRINKVRAKGCTCGTNYMRPAAPLSWNDVLAKAAEGHARDMSKRNYFSHTSKDGRTIEARILAAGYTYQGYKSFAIAENIAQGQRSIAEVTDGWFKSPGHCMNLMNPDLTEIGIAEYKSYWVQDLGGRVPFSTKEQKMIKSGRAVIRRGNVNK